MVDLVLIVEYNKISDMTFEQTWRWYGPNDSISLNEIRQTGATGIVTALHNIPNGEVWLVDDILERKRIIEAENLVWSVVESVPVHEDIKKQSGKYLEYIEAYKQTIINLGKCGIHTICYNFMPVLDWSRTNLEYKFDDSSLALKFDIVAFAAFDIYILKRQAANHDYDANTKAEAQEYYNALSDDEQKKLSANILAGLPGAEEEYSLSGFQKVLDGYKNINADKLKENLAFFIRAIIPVAEQAGVRMAMHPDDPPRALLGLPRVVSNVNDALELIDMYNSESNGITLCTGSFGAGFSNDLVCLTQKIAHRINFVHLRNVNRDEKGNFMENYLFQGDINIPEVMKVIIHESIKRKTNNRKDYIIPLRPDHGNKMLDDRNKITNPGYSLYGRMKGLAELRGLEMGILSMIKNV